MTIWYKKILAVLIGFSLFTPGSLATETEKAFTDVQKQEINKMIREYILEHPEILPEAIQILQNRTKRADLSRNHTSLYEDGYSFIGGNRDGDITLIEFFDYNCSYCKKALDTVERLKKEDPNLKIIYKEFPILSETSYVAAKAAMASMKQGKYEEFHIALFNVTGKLTEEKIFQIAQDVGLDEQMLAKDMASPVLDRNLQINHRLAQELEITGTPGFIIGETIVPGALPYEELSKIISQARQQLTKKAD